jgi:hypothetical protein
LLSVGIVESSVDGQTCAKYLETCVYFASIVMNRLLLPMQSDLGNHAKSDPISEIRDWPVTVKPPQPLPIDLCSGTTSTPLCTVNYEELTPIAVLKLLRDNTRIGLINRSAST